MSTVTEVRLDRIFDEVDDLVPLDGIELLTPSTVHGVVLQSSLGMRPQQALRDGYVVSRARPGDFVISMSSHAHGLEHCAIVGGVSPDYTLLRPKCDPALIPFLRYALKSKPIIHQMSVFKTGVRMGLRLQWNKVRYCKIAIPDVRLASDTAIYLDSETARIDNLIGKKRRFINLLQERRIAAITREVIGRSNTDSVQRSTGNQRVPALPSGWTLMPLKYVAEKIGSGKTPTGGAEVYTQDGVLFLRSQNVYDDGLRLEDVVRIPVGTHEEMSVSRVRPFDVLLNITGASIGRSALVGAAFGEANVNQHVCIIRTMDRHLAPWIHAVLCSHLVKEQIASNQTGAGREGLNFEQVGNMLVTIPPVDHVPSILARIDAECSRIDGLVNKTERSIELLKEHRSALITAAVTGKIDVRAAVAKNLKAAA